MPDCTYGYDEIVAVAEDIGDGYSRAMIELASGQTAESMLSSKWVFLGPGKIQYLIHPAGWTVTPDDQVCRHYL